MIYVYLYLYICIFICLYTVFIFLYIHIFIPILPLFEISGGPAGWPFSTTLRRLGGVARALSGGALVSGVYIELDSRSVYIWVVSIMFIFTPDDFFGENPLFSETSIYTYIGMYMCTYAYNCIYY